MYAYHYAAQLFLEDDKQTITSGIITSNDKIDTPDKYQAITDSVGKLLIEQKVPVVGLVITSLSYLHQVDAMPTVDAPSPSAESAEGR